jgi:polyhydroxyalkanoate synthesis regulator protein
MLKNVTIKLGVTTPTSKQYESARADIETTYSLPDEVAMDLDKAMEMHEQELTRARIMLKDAVRTVKDQLAGKVPEDVGKALKADEAKQLKELLKQYGGD